MTVVTTLPRGGGFTVDDLDAMPDDGNRYELLDGSLIVTPAPSYRHQSVSARLNRLLDRAMSGSPELELLSAPLDARMSTRTNLQPDLLIAPRSDLTEADLPVAPLLAVEILSPSTRHIDLGLKRSANEALGTPSYWVVDPAVPSIIAWELVDGRSVEAGRAEGDQTLELTRPFPVGSCRRIWSLRRLRRVRA